MKQSHLLRRLCLMSLLFLLTPVIVRACNSGSVQIINTNAGRLMTAHAKQYDDKVYVDGLAFRPSAPAIGAHIHVWGVDSNNHLVFSKTTSILFTGSPSLIHTASYVVSIQPKVFSKACVVYATFHNLSHQD